MTEREQRRKELLDEADRLIEKLEAIIASVRASAKESG